MVDVEQMLVKENQNIEENKNEKESTEIDGLYIRMLLKKLEGYN